MYGVPNAEEQGLLLLPACLPAYRPLLMSEKCLSWDEVSKRMQSDDNGDKSHVITQLVNKWCVSVCVCVCVCV